MATDDDLRSVTNTLSGTTADTVTLLQLWPAVEITNHDTADLLYVRMDGVTAAAGADGASLIPAGSTKILKLSPTTTGTHVISIVGDGGTYTIEGVQ